MKRISILANLTKGYDTICDIGCDHGYVIIEALKKNYIKYAYALDINEEPLERAKTNVAKSGLETKVSFYLSDGLLNFEKTFSLAVISGMGGKLIKKILAASWPKFAQADLLLSPQSDIFEVRSFLYSKDYHIIYETAILDKGKYYEIILASPGKKELDYFSLYYGPFSLKERNPCFLAQLTKRQEILAKAYLKSPLINLKEELIRLDYVLEEKMEKVYYYKENYFNKMYIETDISNLVVIFPGGGYNHTSNREAENIGLKFNALGYNVMVFHYRETLDTYETLFLSIAKAIKKEIGSKVLNKFYINGYSAGGHLALELANHKEYYDLPTISGLILAYPVVSSAKDAIHEGSFKNLVAGDETLYSRFSEEKEVNESTPEVFLWHTATDKSVPVLNSLYLLAALKRNNVNFEAHIFPLGAHGLALATKESARDEEDDIPYVASWWDMLVKWLELKK